MPTWATRLAIRRLNKMNSKYLVQIHYEAPYPAVKDYTVEASNFGLAVNRAFARFRKDKITSKRQSVVKFHVMKLNVMQLNLPIGPDT